MNDFMKIHQKAGELADKMFEVMVEYDSLPPDDRPIIILGLRKLHIENMAKSKLAPEEYEEIVETAIELARKDLESFLEEAKHLIPHGKKSELLGNSIKNYIELSLPEKKQGMEPSAGMLSEEKFITLDHSDYFYQKLESEINICYISGSYTAVLILSRKLIENLLIDILRKKYGYKTEEDVEIYYRTNLGRFHDLARLLKNLGERKSDFRIDMDIINEIFKLIKPFRKNANKKAHSIVHLIEEKEELENFNVQRLVSLLIRLFNKI